MRIFYKILLGIGILIDLWLIRLGWGLFSFFLNMPKVTTEFNYVTAFLLFLLFIVSLVGFIGIPWFNLRSLKKEKRGKRERLFTQGLTMVYFILIIGWLFLLK